MLVLYIKNTVFLLCFFFFTLVFFVVYYLLCIVQSDCEVRI